MKKYSSFMAMLAVAAMLFACQKPDEGTKTPEEEKTEQPGGGTDQPGGGTDQPGGGTEQPGGETKGELQFLGSLVDGATFSYNHEARENIDLGYWYGQIRTTGGEWQTVEAHDAENLPYYAGVVFTATDKATNAAADWLTIGYQKNEEGVIVETHWILSVTENTGEARSATVVATFPDEVNGYKLLEANKTLTITVSQAKKAAEGEVLGDMTFANITSRAPEYSFGFDAIRNQNLFYDAVQIRGLDADAAWQTIEANSDESYYNGITVSAVDNATGVAATWLTVARRAQDTWIYADIDANTGAERIATVTVTFPKEANGYKLLDGEETYTFTIRQAAYEETVALDYNSASNLWKAVDEANATKYFYYYAPGWAPLEGCDNTESTECSYLAKRGSSYVLTFANGTWERWQNQFFMYPYDETHYVALKADKTYSFQLTLNASAAFTCYFKLEQFGTAAPKYEGEAIWDKGDVALPAGEDVVIQKTGITGVACDNINLIFDFGTNPEGSTVTVKDIIVFEE